MILLTYLRQGHDWSFARSGHMILNHSCWDANYTMGLPQQRQVKVDWYELLCFGSPTVQRASKLV